MRKVCKKMANFCTKCGAPVNQGSKFCVSCGNPLEQLPEQPAPTPPTPTVLDSQLSSPPPTPNSTLQTPHSPPPTPNSTLQTPHSRKLPLILIIAGVIVVGAIIAVILIFFNNKNEPNPINTPGLPLPTAASTPSVAPSPSPVPSATNPSPDNTPDLPTPSGLINPPDDPEPPEPDFSPDDAYASVFDSVGYVIGDYAFYDIDGNGIDELIIRYLAFYDEYTYIYTYFDSVVYKIGEYWSRNRLVAIDDEGIIYSEGSNGAESSSIEAQRISDNNISLMTVEKWDADYDKNVFTHIANGIETEITVEEFYKIAAEIYFDDGVLSTLTWLPIPSGLGSSISARIYWMDVYGRIRIPPEWDYDIYSEDDSTEWIIISGTGDDILMLIGYIIDGPLETALEESVSYQEFRFDSGLPGYMIEFSDSIVWVYEDSWWDGLMLYHDGDRSIFTDNEAIILAVAATLTYGKTEVAYVKIDENSTSSFLDFIQLPLLIDDVVWVGRNDYDLREKYGLTDDDMDNDYALVNEIEEWISYFATENTSFLLADFSDPASRPTEVSLEEFREYALDRQQFGSSVLAKIQISPTGEVLKIQELYTP